MNLREIIVMRDRLKKELDTVEAFLVIARKEQEQEDNEAADSSIAVPTEKQPVLNPIITETNGDYGSIGKTVVEALKVTPIEFNVSNVEGAAIEIKRPLTRLQISTALARLLKQGKIEMIKEKSGRSPAMYRKK